MNDLHAKPKSTQAKIAGSVLDILQVVAYIFAFVAYLQFLSEGLVALGLSPEDAGSYGWGITIALLVLVGWATDAQKRG